MLEPHAYAASMSSTIGLGLTPITETAPGMKTRHHWTADAGFFVMQDEATSEIRNLGRDAFTDGKIFWSYDPNEPASAEKKPIAISVVTENAKNGRALAQTDMTLVWDGEYLHAAH